MPRILWIGSWRSALNGAQDRVGSTSASRIPPRWGPGDVRAPNDSHSDRTRGRRRDRKEGLQHEGDAPCGSDIPRITTGPHRLGHEGDFLGTDLKAADVPAAQLRHRTYRGGMLGRQSGIRTTRANAAHTDGSLGHGRERDGHPQQLSPAFAVGAVDFDHQDGDRDATFRTTFRASTTTKAVKEITRVRIQSPAVRASVPNGPDRNGA